VAQRYAIDDPQFRRAMGVLLGPAIVPGNKVETLVNGDQIFPSMLGAIHGARTSITFETFIYWSGDIGKAFADALAERARAGVKVDVLLDWVGSIKIKQQYVETMKAAGVQIEYFHPLRWYNVSRMNNRTHRKLLVVDGKIGFTGGVGIAEQWTGHAQDADHWRDLHYRVEGPAVAQMQAAFMDNWIKTSGVVLHGSDYFPALQPAGDMAAQMFMSSPSEGSESMRLMYLLSINAAEHSIRIENAYFVPDDLTVQALVDARKRGVKVGVIVPGDKIDTETVRRASRARWGKLLQAGVKIYEYQPTMLHCKLMIVDDLWVSVGSTNFDNRSFRLNEEANLNVYDRAFAQRQIEIFDEDARHTKAYDYARWEGRPWTDKLIEHASALLRSQL
jgi:Phosphatidylserine/phosphatidylglycerophosphate/cardiolipin synthases and related enzymes